MRLVLTLLLTTTALAQNLQTSHTTESLRGASAVTKEIAWASGTHGTYLRTIDGHHWTAAQVPDALIPEGKDLDFRGVVAFSAEEAFLMSSGPNGLSRIYHTSDAGQHWQLQLKPTDPKAFFDSIAFWDSKHGVVVGDPLPDESGKLKAELFLTEDGENWHSISAALPEAKEGEGSFAASNSCIALKDSNIWFATGGPVARVFHSPDRGKTWQVSDTPIIHGPDSAGIFSIAFRDAQHGVIAGGDYKHPDQDGPNLAFTSDGGKSWTLSRIHPQASFGSAAYDRRPVTAHSAAPERLFLAGDDFIFDLRPPHDPLRIAPARKLATKFNALSAYPEGGTLVVGPKGSIALVP